MWRASHSGTPSRTSVLLALSAPQRVEARGALPIARRRGHSLMRAGRTWPNRYHLTIAGKRLAGSPRRAARLVRRDSPV
jgi:hypothetical protein